MTQRSDELLFQPETPAGHETDAPTSRGWQILVVDDEPEVHQVTTLSLAQTRVLDLPLSFLHAYSATEAVEILNEHAGIAVILLDVVMETDDAGLSLVRTIRETLGRSEVRIILRTGQPGSAPEASVIRDFDINDYKTKNELTHRKLLTTITAAIRSYQQIRTINQNRIGLEKIIHGGATLLEKRSMEAFADGVLTQIASLLGLNAEGILAARALEDGGEDIYIFGAAGHYARYMSRALDTLDNQVIQERIRQCLDERRHLIGDNESVYYFGSHQHAAAVYLESGQPMEAPYPELLEVFLSNVSIGYDNVALFQQLNRAAFEDPLTRLANRNEFIHLLESERCVSSAGSTLVLLDIDHFSDFNHALGQDLGDEMLIAVAQRLRRHFGEQVEIARVDGDVFGLIGAECDLTPDAFYQALADPVRLDGNDFRVMVTLGYCAFPGQVDRGLQLLNRAFMALRMAKNSPFRSVAWFAPEMETRVRERLGGIRALREGFEQQEFVLHYQPQWDLEQGRVTGVEALLRWPRADGSSASPAEFIPLAEQSGLIVRMGLWVIEQACRQLVQLREIGHEGVRVSVNVSMLQFRNAGLVDSVRTLINEYRIAPGQLTLEITESVVMDEPKLVLTTLGSLSEMGVRISLDDFGMGFSSLAYLRQMPLHELKIDKSFVQDMDSPQGVAVIESIIQLANRLQLDCIAEGVETDSQQAKLRQLGCHRAQGFLHAAAMPSDRLLAYLS